MNVLVDTSVWSLALRRRTTDPRNDPWVCELTALIQEGRVILLGPIRQEILSGIRDSGQFERLRQRLRAFPDFPLSESDFEVAAGHFNLCRSHGIQGSNTDFLLCAVASSRGFALFTTDSDFDCYTKHVAFQRHRLRS